MYHDYRVQNPARGFLCLNEIALGIPLSPPMRAVFMEKIGNGSLIRSIVIEGKRFTAQEALNAGIVDALGGLPESLQLVHQRGLLKIGTSPSFVPLKERLWAKVLDAIDNSAAIDASDAHQKTEAFEAEGKIRVQQWEAKKGSKL